MKIFYLFLFSLSSVFCFSQNLVVQPNSPDNIGIIHTIITSECKNEIDALVQRAKKSGQSMDDVMIEFMYDILMPKISETTGLSVKEIEGHYKTLFGITRNSKNISSASFHDRKNYKRVHIELENDLVNLTEQGLSPLDFERKTIPVIEKYQGKMGDDVLLTAVEVAKSTYAYWHDNRNDWTMRGNYNPGKDDIKGGIAGGVAGAITGAGALVGGMLGALGGTLVGAIEEAWF